MTMDDVIGTYGYDAIANSGYFTPRLTADWQITGVTSTLENISEISLGREPF